MCEDTRGVSTAVLWNGIRSSPPCRLSGIPACTEPAFSLLCLGAGEGLGALAEMGNRPCHTSAAVLCRPFFYSEMNTWLLPANVFVIFVFYFYLFHRVLG